MFGRKQRKPEPRQPVVQMPYEAEILDLGPGQHFIMFWKGRPLFIRPATVLDIEAEIDRGKEGQIDER